MVSGFRVVRVQGLGSAAGYMMVSRPSWPQFRQFLQWGLQKLPPFLEAHLLFRVLKQVRVAAFILEVLGLKLQVVIAMASASASFAQE